MSLSAACNFLAIQEFKLDVENNVRAECLNVNANFEVVLQTDVDVAQKT